MVQAQGRVLSGWSVWFFPAGNMAYFGNSDFTGLVADDFNHKKKDKSSSSTDVSGNKRKGTAVERARVRLQESGDKTTKLFHTMGDMVSSDIRFAGFKREGTDDDIKVHRERTDGGDDDDVKVHFEKPVDAITIRDEQQKDARQLLTEGEGRTSQRCSTTPGVHRWP